MIRRLDAATPAQRLSQLLLLALATWAVSYTRFLLGPLQEAMRSDLGLSDNQVAWLQGPALAVPMVLASVPMGLLVDRYPRVPLIVCFVAVGLAAAILSGMAPSLLLLFLARCLAGIAIAAIFVATYSTAGDLYAPEQRGRAIMIVSLGESLAAPAAFAVGGTLLAVDLSGIFGAEMPAWKSALLAMCAPLLPVLVLVLLLREPPRTGIVNKTPSLRQVWPELWRYRGVVAPLLVARIMVWIADGAVVVWGAPSFARGFGLPPEQVGAIMAAALLIGCLLGPVLAGPLADMCQRSGGPRRTMTALYILALLSTPLGLFAVMPDAKLASVALTAFLTIGYVIGSAAMALATIVIPGELRGLYIALTVTLGAFFCIGVAPLVVSGLSGLLGGPSAIGVALAIVSALGSILAAAVFRMGRRHFPGEACRLLRASEAARA